MNEEKAVIPVTLVMQVKKKEKKKRKNKMNDYSTHLCAKPLPFKNKAASALDNQSRHAQNSLLFRYILFNLKRFLKCRK